MIDNVSFHHLSFYGRKEKEMKSENTFIFSLLVGDLQAIKKVLIENFHEKEEAHPQVLLYKNLWLEAEAALCSINYMARFNNMKNEIEKCKLDSEKG